MEEYVLSAESPANRNIVSSPQADYTGTGNQNDTRMEAVKRSTMLGVNLFGSKKVKKVDHEKKVNFESGSDGDRPSNNKRKQHYHGNFQSQYRKKQFVESPASDSEEQ